MPHPACKVHRQPLATEVLRGQRYKYSPNHPHPQAFLMHFSSTIHIFSSTRAGNREKSRGLFAPKQKCSRQTGGDYRDKKRSALHQPSHRTAFLASPFSFLSQGAIAFSVKRLSPPLPARRTPSGGAVKRKPPLAPSLCGKFKRGLCFILSLCIHPLTFP